MRQATPAPSPITPGEVGEPLADAARADLQRRGVDVGEMLRWPEAPAMFAVRDQDGNGLEIVEV